ncbi:unnamed protein product [Brachionus calyciflorus]|uniref:Uncharacterized protein n=1 Tax=Brachionus calyciflorus TaxID=104777 RepID=A0A814C2V0_9BILA|nr:unnamed protein product [Brachionus calyciflorus]
MSFSSIQHKNNNSLRSSFSEDANNNYLSTSLSYSSSYSSPLTPSKQLLLESTNENMDVIKEFRNLFLEKYLEKNKIGRKSKINSKSKNSKNVKFAASSIERHSDNSTSNEYSNTKEQLEKFQIEFFNNSQTELFDLKSQSFSLNLNSYNLSESEFESHVSNSYSGNYCTNYGSFNYAKSNIVQDEPYPNNDSSSRGFNRNSGELFRARNSSEIYFDNEKQYEDDNKIFNLEIESTQNHNLFNSVEGYTEFSSIF